MQGYDAYALKCDVQVGAYDQHFNMLAGRLDIFTALVLALREAQRLGATSIDLRLDSKLIVEQLHGRWKVKDAKMREWWTEARSLLAEFDAWDATHEPRATNKAADALANMRRSAPKDSPRLAGSLQMMAAIQREHITNAQASNLFWINAGLGVTLSLVAVAVTRNVPFSGMS